MNTITGKDLKSKMASKKVFAVAIDPEGNYKKAHIKGSVNIPYSDKEFVKKVQKQMPKKESHVALCAQSGYTRELNDRARELEQSGFTQISKYQGGLSDWETSKLDIQRGA